MEVCVERASDGNGLVEEREQIIRGHMNGVEVEMERRVGVEDGLSEAGVCGRGVEGAFEGDFGGASMEKSVVDDDALGGVAAGGLDGVPMDGLGRGGLRWRGWAGRDGGGRFGGEHFDGYLSGFERAGEMRIEN